MVDTAGTMIPRGGPQMVEPLVWPLSWGALANQFASTGFFVRFPKPGGGDNTPSGHHTPNIKYSAL
jgi:hypothetical protein